MTEQGENMKAIDGMFRRETPVNPTAAAIKSSWRSWYDGLKAYHRESTASIYTDAKKRRDAFFKAQEQGAPKPAATPTSTGKPMADTPIVLPGPRPTLRSGIHKTQPSTKPYVVEWQRIIKVTPDGLFGSGTDSATRAWQRARGLAADGIVGPKSWSQAQLESTQAMATPTGVAQAANQASQQIAQAISQATNAAAGKPPAQAAQAAKATAVQSAVTAAAQAANAAAGKKPAPTTTARAPSASAPSSTASVVDTATSAINSVKSQIASAHAGAPVWVRAVAVTGGVFAGLIGLKALFGKKRAA